MSRMCRIILSAVIVSAFLVVSLQGMEEEQDPQLVARLARNKRLKDWLQNTLNEINCPTKPVKETGQSSGGSSFFSKSASKKKAEYKAAKGDWKNKIADANGKCNQAFEFIRENFASGEIGNCMRATGAECREVNGKQVCAAEHNGQVLTLEHCANTVPFNI